MARSKFEIKAQEELEENGWIVDWKIRPSGFKNPQGYNVDFFGLFDLLAYSPYIIRAIAIKGQGGVPSSLRRSIEEFRSCDHFVKEIWTFRQKKVKGKRMKNTKYIIKKEIIE